MEAAVISAEKDERGWVLPKTAVPKDYGLGGTIPFGPMWHMCGRDCEKPCWSAEFAKRQNRKWGYCE